MHGSPETGLGLPVALGVAEPAPPRHGCTLHPIHYDVPRRNCDGAPSCRPRTGGSGCAVGHMSDRCPAVPSRKGRKPCPYRLTAACAVPPDPPPSTPGLRCSRHADPVPYVHARHESNRGVPNGRPTGPRGVAGGVAADAGPARGRRTGVFHRGEPDHPPADHEPGCVFCGEAYKVVEFNGHNVCRQCVAAMPQRSEAQYPCLGGYASAPIVPPEAVVVGRATQGSAKSWPTSWVMPGKSAQPSCWPGLTVTGSP